MKEQYCICTEVVLMMALLDLPAKSLMWNVRSERMIFDTSGKKKNKFAVYMNKNHPSKGCRKDTFR